MFFSWNRYQDAASSKAVILAQSLETLLQPEDIAELSGGTEDLKKPEYIITKRNLSQLAQATNDIVFAYLMGIKDGNIVFLMDSELPDSPGYSPPGQVYEEADEVTWEAFRPGKTILSDPKTDRWGTWISALVPVKNPVSGQVIAVFALDFSASEWYLDLWKQMIPDMIIVLFFLLFIVALASADHHYLKLKALSGKLAFDEALYHSVYDQAPVGIAFVNGKRFVAQSEYGNVNMNPMFEKILGRTSLELANIQWTDITHPDDLQIDLEQFEQFSAGKIDGYTLQKRFLKPDGSYVWTTMKISHFLDGLRDNPMHLCLLDDISEEKEIEDSLRESERSKSVLITNLPGMAYRCNYDRDWTMQFASAGCYALTGYAPESFISNKDLSFNDVITPEYRDMIWNEWGRIVDEKQQFKLEYEIITASGERKWVLEIGNGIYNEKGKAEALEGIILDISDRKKMENELIYINEHDSPTGLYNRIYLDNLLIKDQKEHLPKKRAVICINMSAVQSLSMTYGFNYAQDLIKKVADTLNRFATEKRILVRSFENRFVYYIKDYNDKNELMEFSREIADSFEPILTAERIGAGIGVFEIDPDEELDLNKLSKRVLILSEKAAGSEDREIGICYYDNKMEAYIEREEDIKRELTDIATCEGDGGLYLHYQPIFDLKTDKICGFEALARLKTERHGQVPPLEFIPIAEKTKLIIPIGWRIARRAFCFLKRLKSSGYDKTYISINVSAIQLIKHDFADNLFEMINEMQVDPENIGIEITESVFASDYDEINKIINRLRDCGLKVAIDDFGTEYSSLSRESELNIDCIKIDKHFIDNLMRVRHDHAITSDIISIGHKLGHCTVAEGVEYEEQKQYLQDCGCDKIQGYLISKPLDEEAAIELLGKETSIKNCCQENSHDICGETKGADISPEKAKRQMRQILDSITESIFGIDADGRITFCNNNCAKTLGYGSTEDLIGKNLSQLLYMGRSDSISASADDCVIFQAMDQGKSVDTGEEVFRRADGARLEAEYHSCPEEKDGKVVGSVITFIDVLDRKKRENELRYLSCHDTMTGLCNRYCYETSLNEFDRPENLPLSVVFADINGLKITNDIFGHKAGDELIKKTAGILKRACCESDFIARIGGDEFIILMPRTSADTAERVISQIRAGFAGERLSAVKCSSSLGRDTKINPNQSLEVVIANAESAMYKDKTLNLHSVNSEIIDTIVETLHQRNPREKRHSAFVSELCGELGYALKLTEAEISKLKRAGHLHDIGKISIDESILGKDDPTEEEQRKIQLHSVAGYRILNFFEETLDLAECVYVIHERWDGSGYPLGLKGEQIPLISRIISVADSYENWLNGGTCSDNAKKTAIERIRAEGGKMFDPNITEIFVEMINK